MPNYRPLADFWLLARPKRAKGSYYYGSFPSGYLERARALLGVNLEDPVLHVCGGKARDYVYRYGFGPNDKTLDLDPALKPDYLLDARNEYPLRDTPAGPALWPAILADPPYSEEDAEKYVPGAKVLPTPGRILRNSLKAVRPGGRIGLLGYYAPQPTKDARLIAMVGVVVGYNNRIRIYSVYERITG